QSDESATRQTAVTRICTRRLALRQERVSVRINLTGNISKGSRKISTSSLARSLSRTRLACAAFLTGLLRFRRAARRRLGGHCHPRIHGDRHVSAGDLLLAEAHWLSTLYVAHWLERRVCQHARRTVIGDNSQSSGRIGRPSPFDRPQPGGSNCAFGSRAVARSRCVGDYPGLAISRDSITP